MSYKTLILIDNSNELTSLNKEIAKECVKYFVRNAGEDNKVAIAVTGTTAEYLTEFDDSLNTHLKTIDSIEFTDSNAPGVDVLMDVILDWKKGDLAKRDILYISGRNIGIMGDYSEEELLFEINNKQYPIYTIACSQDENDGVIKGLGVLSRISGGDSISTADIGSDASIEKQICKKIMASMEEYRTAEEERFAGLEEDVATGNEEVSGQKSSDIRKSSTSEEMNDESDGKLENGELENGELVNGELVNGELENEELTDEELTTIELTDDQVIYEYSEGSAEDINPTVLFYPGLIILIFIALVLIRTLLKKQKEKRADEKYKKSVSDNAKRDDISEYPLPFSDAGITTETTLLNSYSMEDDTGTRLLYQTKEGMEITLEDRADPTKYFRARVRDTIVIGRNDKLCDIAVTYDDSISSRHCELFLRDNRLYCRDLGSSNGTMVNQQKVYQEIEVESGDILRIGRLTFFIQIVGD